MERSKKKIVTITGGTGGYALLSGLKKRFDNIAAIVAMADDGGSTGVLRDELGILPPGSVRLPIMALSDLDDQDLLAGVMHHRFEEGQLEGHNLGNLLIAGLIDITGSFEGAIEALGEILSMRGRVLPVTLQDSRLHARRKDGSVVVGETNIDIPREDMSTTPIEEVWLEPTAHVNPGARQAIFDAEIIVIGPGDLYTSIFPNLVVKGVRSALQETRGRIFYITNIMTKHGETDGFAASDFLRVVEKYLGEGVVDVVLANERMPHTDRLQPYEEERATIVECDAENFRETPELIVKDFLREEGFARHDSEKLATAIFESM